MGGIENIFGLNSEIQKSEKSINAKKIPPKNKPKKTEESGKSTVLNKDQAQISDQGRSLFSWQVETMRYLDIVQKSDAVSEEDISKIKEKLASNYYLREEVVEQIAEKLMKLPFFR